MTDQSDPNFLDDLAREVRAASSRLADLEETVLLAQLGMSTPARMGIGLESLSAYQGGGLDLGSGPLTPAAVIQDGAVTDTSFASTIDPVLLRTTAQLTNADAIANPNRVAFNTDNAKLYRSDGATWTVAVDGADIIAASIIAGKIAAGAISTTDLAALAVTAAKIAAMSITADKLVVGEFANGLTNPGFETGDLTGWDSNPASGGSCATTTSGPQTGKYAAVISNAAATGSYINSQGFIAVKDAGVVAVGAWLRGQDVSGDSADLGVQFFDSALGFISAASSTFAVTGTNTFYRAKITAPAGAAFGRVYVFNNTANKFIVADDVSFGTRGAIIGPAGVTILNGALVVENAGATVIIDGTSNMFKIQASGNMASSFPAAGGAHTVNTTISGSGSSVRQTLFMTGYDDSSTANLRGLDGVEAVISGSGTISFRAYTYVKIASGDNQLNLVAESSISNPGTTAMARYYLLTEAGI
jgi:hypothetical protein